MDYATKKPSATLLEPGHLEDHRASPEGETKGLSLVGLVKEVAARDMDSACLVKSGMQHGTASYWSPD